MTIDYQFGDVDAHGAGRGLRATEGDGIRRHWQAFEFIDSTSARCRRRIRYQPDHQSTRRNQEVPRKSRAKSIRGS